MAPDPILKPKPPEQHKIHYGFRSQMKQMGAGAASSALTRFFTQPFEVLKIRFQLQVEPLRGGTVHTSKYTSFFQACSVILKEEGITAFWKGHNAGQLLSVVYGTSQFWSYEQIKLLLSQTELIKDHQYINRFVSGGASGVVATVFSMPFDVIRTRLVSQDHEKGYRNATQALPKIFRQEGIRGLYRGVFTQTVQIIPLVGSNFAFYGIFNDIACKILSVDDHKRLPTLVILSSGGIAGTLSKVVVYPLDFVKRRLQVQGFHEHRKTYGKTQECHNIRSCIAATMRHEGLSGFYKGMTPTLFKSGLSTALYFGFYERAKQFLDIV